MKEETVQMPNPIVDDLTQAFDQIAFQQRPFIFRGWLQETHTPGKETYFPRIGEKKREIWQKYQLQKLYFFLSLILTPNICFP